jgi:hypothetical protein
LWVLREEPAVVGVPHPEILLSHSPLRYLEADILVSSDHLRSTLEPGDEGLEKPAEAGSPMNIGEGSICSS